MACRRLTLIYDADGGLLGELRYALGKLLGRGSCSLCALTHTSLGKERPAWQRCASLLRVPVRQLHRDELEPALARFVQGRLPSVVAELDEGFAEVLDPAALAACAGRVGVFQERLAARSAALDLDLF